MPAFSSLSFNPASFSGFAFDIDGGTVTETIARPNGDQANAGWQASTGLALWPMLDEITPDPSDYIYATATGATCTLGLSSTVYPGTASQALKFRASSSSGNSVVVALKQGVTTVKSVTQALTPADTEYSFSLSPAEIAAITSGVMSVQLTSA